MNDALSLKGNHSRSNDLFDVKWTHQIPSGPHAGPLLLSPTNLGTWNKKDTVMRKNFGFKCSIKLSDPHNGPLPLFPTNLATMGDRPFFVK